MKDVSSNSASPSPTLPLILLALVLFLVIGPWLMSSEAGVEEAVIRAKTGFPAEALILIPAVILIVFQLYGSYDHRQLRWKLPEVTRTDSALALVGVCVVVMLLMWIRSSVNDMIQAL